MPNIAYMTAAQALGALLFRTLRDHAPTGSLTAQEHQVLLT
jgi:hypothetical protein